MSYFRLVISKTLTETKAVWNVHRIWIYFASPVAGILVRAFFRGIKQTGNWQELVLFAFIGFIITWLGTFLINLIRVPGMLHAGQAREISKLKEIAYPQVDPEEKGKRDLVSQKLDGLTKQRKKVLRCIISHGKILIPALKVEFGFTREDVDNTVRRGTQTCLLFSDREIVSVNDEFKSALDYLLKQEGL
jgi:hypothetical protein